MITDMIWKLWSERETLWTFLGSYWFIGTSTPATAPRAPSNRRMWGGGNSQATRGLNVVNLSKVFFFSGFYYSVQIKKVSTWKLIFL